MLIPLFVYHYMMAPFGCLIVVKTCAKVLPFFQKNKFEHPFLGRMRTNEYFCIRNEK